MFADSELDIKKKAKEDEVWKEMLNLSGDTGFWAEKYYLLGGIFEERGMPRGELHELSK